LQRKIFFHGAFCRSNIHCHNIEQSTECDKSRLKTMCYDFIGPLAPELLTERQVNDDPDHRFAEPTLALA
jgi:hypothetical protein